MATENEYVNYIRSKLDERTLLEQLAEESAEFTQATLKLIRAMKLNDNATPVTEKEAMGNLVEEYNDMRIVMRVTGLTDDDYSLYHPKLQRWAERLGYKDE